MYFLKIIKYFYVVWLFVNKILPMVFVPKPWSPFVDNLCVHDQLGRVPTSFSRTWISPWSYVVHANFLQQTQFLF
jgi:hypothetical protein